MILSAAKWLSPSDSGPQSDEVRVSHQSSTVLDTFNAQASFKHAGPTLSAHSETDGAKEADGGVLRLPPEMARFMELRRKSFRSAQEQAEWQSLMGSAAVLESALNMLSQKISDVDHLVAVDFLLKAMSTPNAAIRATVQEQVGQFIVSVDLDSGSPSERRSRAADVAELTVAYLANQPAGRDDLLAAAKGVNRVIIERAVGYMERSLAEIRQARTNN